jgi:hypothetical protein
LPKHGRVDILQQFQGPGRQGIALLAPELPADIPMDVLGIKFDLVQDNSRCFQHIHPYPISRKPGYPVLAIRSLKSALHAFLLIEVSLYTLMPLNNHFNQEA